MLGRENRKAGYLNVLGISEANAINFGLVFTSHWARRNHIYEKRIPEIRALNTHRVILGN